MNNASDAWLYAMRNVSGRGMFVGPRTLLTREMINQQVTISAAKPLVMVKPRKLSYKFAAAEALWIISGQNLLQPLEKYAPSYRRFSDDGITLFGAYGPPIIHQLGHVIGTLSGDPLSRQAVISLWRINPGMSKDIPCTLSLQFLIRESRLHCIASMRSSDVWLGLPYDLFSFTMVTAYVYLKLLGQASLIGKIGAGLGNVCINAGSQHLYETDYAKVTEVLENPEILDICDMSIQGLLYPDHLKQCLGFVLDDPCYLVGVKIPPFFQQMREYAQTQA